MAKWFVSEERSLLERLIRSRIAECHAEIANSYTLNKFNYESATAHQEEQLRDAERYATALAVIAEIDSESSKAAESKEPPFVFTDNIAVT